MIREQVLSPLPSARTSRPRLSDRVFRRGVERSLGALERGRLTIVDADGARTFGEGDLHATVVVHDGSLYRLLATRGVLGAAEAWMDGAWDTDDLVAVIRILARGGQALRRLDGGVARLLRPLLRAAGGARSNTRDGSRENISAHYDLGNEFFESFLDRSMTYSSAVYEDPAATLEQAQAAKYERICRKLGLGPEHHVLEIGTGWGGFALHAAARHGCRVTTTTISQRQLALAKERVAAARLEDRIELLFRDYRDLDGQYDRIVSIEMIEAVGHEFMETFFAACRDRLKPDGAMLLQAIVNRDQEFEESKRSVEFIKKYIFPGGQLPTVWSMCEASRRATDFRLVQLEDITPHYARTLAEWRRRLHAGLERVRELGYGQRFLRMWEFYLCYCEGGFEERAVGAVQAVFERPDSRRDWLVAREAAAPAWRR